VVLRSVSRAARVVVAVNLLASGTIAVGPGLVSAVYGPEFAEAASLVRWLGLTLLIAPLGHLCSTLWTGTGRLRPVLVAGGAGAVVDVGLAWLLIPSLAAVGAVVATASAQAVTALVIIVHTFRSGVRLELRPRRLTAAGTATAITGWPGELAAVVVFCGATALGARLLGLFDPEDVDWLAQTLPARIEPVLRRLTPPRDTRDQRR